MNLERRTSDRALVKFQVNYIHKEDYLISFSRDISVDGMFLCTENPPSVGDYPRLSFSIGEMENVTVTAKVVWVSPTGSAAGPGMAVQFLELPPTILKIVSRFSVLEPDGNA
jgi:Tfp pilus assembly protein PilZ